jgi:hypothetical protein
MSVAEQYRAPAGVVMLVAVVRTEDVANVSP